MASHTNSPDYPIAQAVIPVSEIPARPRSLRMQYRFWRTIFFAWWLMGRLLFWYFVMARIIGSERVQRGNIRRWQHYARQFRRFAIAMGGVMIKLGQFVSTRVDILPPEVIAELESLQDEVPSVPFDKIRGVIEAELGSVSAHFQAIDETPIAAASLGQAHRARLENGDRVVVKVQRPGIRTICYTDLAALKAVARLAMRFSFVRRRADANLLAEEFGRVLLEELSYEQEARNAARFGKIFAENMGVYIPAVYPQHSTDRVITLEDVTTIKINDYAAIETAGINRKAVAARLLETYFKMIFEERFFHADPHPGNLFIYPLPVVDEKADFGAQGRPFYLIFVDFGMTGSLTKAIASGLVDTLGAVIARDADKLVRCYANLGILLPDADVSRLADATAATFDQVWGMSMAEIQNMDYGKIADIGREFNDLLYAMPFRLPQDFIYLGRTVGILSGMCTSLEPLYNPWHELQPYVRRLIARGFGTNGADGEFAPGLPGLVDLFNGHAPRALFQLGQAVVSRALEPPRRADAVMTQLSRGNMTVKAELSDELRQRLSHLESSQKQTTRAVMFGSLLITSTLFTTSGEATLGLIGYGLTGVAFLVLLFGRE